MIFKNVLIHSLDYVLGPEVCSSEHIENQISQLYQKLHLNPGRLEWMTGIKERRFWPKESKPSSIASLAAKSLLDKVGAFKENIGILIHAGVCRDALEPATAAYVHQLLKLDHKVQFMDVSNACLGFLNAMVMLAGLIESGVVKAGLIVSGENGKSLLDNTISSLLDEKIDRKAAKLYFSNLTIGAGSVAALLCHRSLSEGINFIGGTCTVDSSVNHLCEGQSLGKELFMQTQAESLLEAGLQLADQNWMDFKKALGWELDQIDHFICHQVGKQHHLKLYETLKLPLLKDFSSYSYLGNMGSVSLPITLAIALEKEVLKKQDKVALLGIGSGLSSLMLGLSI